MYKTAGVKGSIESPCQPDNIHWSGSTNWNFFYNAEKDSSGNRVNCLKTHDADLADELGDPEVTGWYGVHKDNFTPMSRMMISFADQGTIK
jgi:hypothetical protein